MKTLFRILGTAAAVAVTGAAIVVLDKILNQKDPLHVEEVEFPEEAEQDAEEAEKTAEAYAEAEAKDEAKAADAAAEAAEEAIRMAEIARKLGYTSHSGDNGTRIRKRIDALNLSTEHFALGNKRPIKRDPSNIFIENSTAD